MIPEWLDEYPGIVAELSLDGTVVASNGRLEQVVGSDVVGRPFQDLLDAGPTRGKWARMLESRRAAGPPPIGWELILCAGDTSLEPSAFSLLGSAGSDSFWLVEHPGDPRLGDIREAVTDVNAALVHTQRELVRERGQLAAAMRELERSNRALDDFAHAVSHDLRAPLRGLANYAGWIVEDLGEAAAPARAHLDGLQEQVGRLQAMIEGVLRFARLGRTAGDRERVDVAALVGEAAKVLPVPEGVEVVTDPSLPVLLTERAALFQVLLNLLGNAVAHGGEGVSIRVSASEAAGLTEFAVADDGPGVPEPMRERIWTLFHTGASAAEARGTGIGLAVVKRLVEDRGGRAWVEETPGGGATFRFTWPG